VNLSYEVYCFKYYEDLLVLLKMNMEKHNSLESDLEQLETAENLSWGMRMALLYRSEKKKIVRNQIDLVRHFATVCLNAEAVYEDGGADAYKSLVLRKTAMEEVEFDKVQNASPEEKTRVSEWFWYRRLVNCEYFSKIFEIISGQE
jgi:hypothetical protein